MRSKLMGTMAALSLAVLLTACGNNGQDAGSSKKEPVQTTESARAEQTVSAAMAASKPFLNVIFI